jgi:hypothetical protein
MRYIVDSWWNAGILGGDSTYYLIIVAIWSILALQGIYRFAMNFFELFKEDIEQLGREINKWVDETREARRLYFESKKNQE